MYSNEIDTATTTAINYILPIECSVLSSTPDASPEVDSYAESKELLFSTDLLTCKYRENTNLSKLLLIHATKNYTGTTRTK